MEWVILGVAGWLLILFYAIACAKASGRQWPEPIERFRDEDQAWLDQVERYLDDMN